MFTLKNICIHHWGGVGNDRFASTQHLTEQHIENAHKSRWPGFTSAFGFHIGYNVMIFPDGTWRQYRLVGEETAAVIGHNTDSFHIALAGNFNRVPLTQRTVDPVTPEMKETLEKIMTHALNGTLWQIGIMTAENATLNFTRSRIYAHRFFSPTDCYGTGLPDTWARDLLISQTSERERLQKELATAQSLLLKLLFKLLDSLRKQRTGLSAEGREDPETIPLSAVN